MTSSAINKDVYFFLETNKIARARRASAICGFWKNEQALLYSELHEKNNVIMY